jgi:hypothetical protein
MQFYKSEFWKNELFEHQMESAYMAQALSPFL